MNLRRKIVCCVVLLAMPAAGMMPVWAGGPLYVTGPSATQPGQAYRWALNPIPYYTDKGALGNQTNAQATDLVAEAFQVWQSAATANISFQNMGQLSYDVTSVNILTFENAIGSCSDTSQPVNSVVFDVNGSILAALGEDNNSILGVSSAICANDTTGVYTRGWSLLNGRFIDGQPNTTSHATVTLDRFRAVFEHELGHLIGLDHSQINLNCLTDASCPTEDLNGVPVMFPILLDNATATLKTDDLAAVGALYPSSGFSSTTGRIQGRVFFADGRTPAEGYNVIARLVGDPRTTAVSCVSGFLFSAIAGNALVPALSAEDIIYGSHDPTLIGYYDLPGLPPGTYTIEVEALYNSGDLAFIGGSGVGPIGSFLSFQYKMPGTCSLQYLNYPSSAGDSCSAKSTVTVAAGITVDTNADVILLGSQSRYDSWEDGL